MLGDMPVAISMLRGVNLGKRRLKMEELRAVYQSLGLRDVETHVQSGNVVFRTEGRAPKNLDAAIEGAIERKFGFRSAVILRSPGEMREVIAGNPFAGRPGIDPAKLLVWFLAADPGDEARQKARAVPAGTEEVHTTARELYIYFPDGLARPKLSMTAVERCLKVAGTGRNWNTVEKLAEIAERMDAAAA
jgi:uncharacterized protein (DUF1697 family)